MEAAVVVATDLAVVEAEVAASRAPVVAEAVVDAAEEVECGEERR